MKTQDFFEKHLTLIIVIVLLVWVGMFIHSFKTKSIPIVEDVDISYVSPLSVTLKCDNIEIITQVYFDRANNLYLVSSIRSQL